MEKLCKKHGLTDYNNHNHCKKCVVEAVTKRRRNVKIKAVEYKGGKCQKCGYDKCMDALEFHHINPAEKEFGIASGDTRAWSKIQLELDKCTLLCSNCHKEEHYYNPL